jgi:hypothetical protein
MTGYGPPPGPPAGPPSGPPGNYGPPSPGNYGPPPGNYGPPPGYGGGRPAFNPAAVNPLEWALIGGGVIALIFSFFEFYTVSAKGQLKAACDQGVIPSGNCSDSGSAWHGFFGWFGVILLLVTAVITALIVLVPQTKLPFPGRLVALGAAVLGALSILIALFVDPSVPGSENVRPGVNIDDFIDIGRGFSYWLILIVAVAVSVAAFMRFQQEGGVLPGLGGSAAARPFGAPQGPPPGYGIPQAPPPGYGPPPSYGPPPGYGPPPNYGPPPGQAQQAPQQPGPSWAPPAGQSAPPPYAPPSGPASAPPQAPPPAPPSPPTSAAPGDSTTVVPNWTPPNAPQDGPPQQWNPPPQQ